MTGPTLAELSRLPLASVLSETYWPLRASTNYLVDMSLEADITCLRLLRN